MLAPSLSARRAWIEISVTRYKPTPKPVALRKESVDRNIAEMTEAQSPAVSLSARRAWIEMRGMTCKETGITVALRKESVDRNSIVLVNIRACIVALRKESVDRNDVIVDDTAAAARRSPQGERG